MEELDAFTGECDAIDGTLAGVPADAWGRPALGEWALTELVAHLVRGASRVDAYLDEPVEGDAPACDRVSYWQFDLAAEAPAIAERARREAAKVDAETLPALFSDSWRASAQRAGGLPPGQLLATPRGPMRLGDYLATRVVELVVHHLDVRAALDLPPAPTPAAGRLAMEVLEGLLGTPRPRNLGRTRFILAATGRIAVDDDRFPVLR